MTPQKPFPPRTLAEALDYYGGADFINAINTAKMEGKAEGRAEGRAEGIAEVKQETASKMKAKGFSAEDIADVTGLTIEVIRAL